MILPSTILNNQAPDALSNTWDLQIEFPKKIREKFGEFFIPGSRIPFNLELSSRVQSVRISFPKAEVSSVVYKTWTVEHQSPAVENSAVSLSLTFRVDESLYLFDLFYSWMSLYINHQIGAVESYVSSENRGKVFLGYRRPSNFLSGTMRSKKLFVFHGCWVQEVGEISFTRAEGNSLDMTVVFRALRLEVVDGSD